MRAFQHLFGDWPELQIPPTTSLQQDLPATAVSKFLLRQTQLRGQTRSGLLFGSVRESTLDLPLATAARFGDAEGPGTPIGSPQFLIVRDERAFLPGWSGDGARYVSETSLRENGVYPLQIKTAEPLRHLVAGGSAAALLLFRGVWARTRRRPA